MKTAYSIVVAPRVHFVLVINHADIAASKTHGLDSLLYKGSFYYRLFGTTLKERSILLESSDKSGKLLIVLYESIGSSCTERPAPEYHSVYWILSVLISHYREVLRVICVKPNQREVLQSWDRCVVVDIVKLIGQSELSLEVQASCVDRSIVCDSLDQFLSSSRAKQRVQFRDNLSHLLINR